MDEMRKALQVAKENEKTIIESVVFFARYNRLYYEELLRRGFTASEAMELTKAHGFTFGGSK